MTKERLIELCKIYQQAQAVLDILYQANATTDPEQIVWFDVKIHIANNNAQQAYNAYHAAIAEYARGLDSDPPPC